MKCEICKRGTATFYRYVAAVEKQIPICAVCFQSQKHSFPKSQMTLGFDGLLGALMNFQPVDDFYVEGGSNKGRGCICSNCGFEFEEYYQRGGFGCIKCYDTFCEQIRPVVYKIHGCVRHNGSRPPSNISPLS